MRRQNKLYILTVLLFSFACTSSSNPVVAIENDDWKVYYFDFDQVDYYQTAITENETFVLEDKKRTKNEDLLLSLLTGDRPVDLDDTSFISKLGKLGFAPEEIAEEKWPLIKDLFREKSDDPANEWSLCLPVYRDLLIFRKENKIEGIVKICFACDDIQIRGSKADTRNFRSNKGFRKLWNILHD